MNKRFMNKVACLAIIGMVLPSVSFASEKDLYDATKDYSINFSMTRKKASADEIINFAKQQLGKPYVWGSNGPTSFDCSGLVYYVFSNNGYDMPKSNVAGYWSSPSIKKVSNPQKGDLIFFKGTYGGDNNPSHIGIMLNENEFINASSGGGKVQINNKNEPYWNQHFLGYGRIIPDAKPAPNPTDGTFGTAYINVQQGWGVNTYDAPNGTYKGAVHGGDSYVVYNYKDGYYDIGNSTWVREDYVKFNRDVAYINVTEGWGVNTYDGPNGNYKGTVHGGESYVVYAYKDGYYDIGNSTWVRGDYVQIHRTY